MWRLAVLALAACGRVGFDATGDALATSDASPVAFDAPFSAPVLISELAGPDDEDDPSLTGDLLELYYSSSVPTSDSLWKATRPSVASPWSTPELVAPINAGGKVNNPKVSLDGLTLYFSSTRAPSAGGSDLWVSTRASRADDWSAPTRITELASAVDDYEPYVLPGNLTMYFTRKIGNNGEPVRTNRPNTSLGFRVAIEVPGIEQTGYEGGCFVTPDELGILFHSDRGADRDIYRATKAVFSDPFSPAVPLTELDMGMKEEDPWLSPDGHVLFFAANPTGQYDLYMATR